MSIAERLKVIVADITQQSVDAIVNAANPTLLGGGGVDGAIHRAAGPDLLSECETLGGCPRGEARITAGYELPAKYVIHTPGPVWEDGNSGEEETLANCYRACLQLATENDARTIAFPAISTGIYGFPKDLAAQIAIGESSKWLSANELPAEVIFCCFADEDRRYYDEVIAGL